MFFQGALQRRQITLRREALDGTHLAICHEAGWHQARCNRLTREQNRTRTAEAFAADGLGAGQEELVAKNVDQGT